MALSKNKIKQYRLLQQKKFRDKEGLFVIEGEKMVFEAIASNLDDTIEIICTEKYDKKLPSSCQNIASITDYSTISKISSLSSPQEIIAIIKKPHIDTPKLNSFDDLVLVLDSVSDPGNLGTIIRMADWFGVKKIVCSINCVDCFNPKTVQATMGSILRIQLYYTDIGKFISEAQRQNIPAYGTALDGKDIYKENIRFPALIVMGNEANGISESIKEQLTQNLLIPSYSNSDNRSESLNVSTATAIILGEFRRQQYYSK